MAVAWKVENSRNSEYFMDPRDIEAPAELNGRHELPNIEALIESICERGQLQACGVRSEGGKPVLVFGFSRWRAILEINQRKIVPGGMKLLVRNVQGAANSYEGFVSGIHENIRNPTTQLDDAHNIAQFRRWGKTDEEIAEIFHRDTRWVQDRAKLLNAEPEVQKAVKDGRIKPTAAKAIAKLSAEAQREVISRPEGAKKPENARPSMKLVIRSIADGGIIPWDAKFDGTPAEFCKGLLNYAEGK